MRTVLTLMASIVALAGCQSDEQYKQQWREATLNVCLEESRKREMPAGYDAARVCSCAIDRLMRGKSTDELSQGNAMQEEAQVAARQCAVEAVNASGGASGAGAAGSNAAAGAATR